jgi:hypothetical protein
LWKIFRDTHEPIIAQADFDTVQELVEAKKSKRQLNKLAKPEKPVSENCPLNSRLVYCSGQKQVKISTIRELVLDAIRRVCLYAAGNPFDFINRCYEQSVLKKSAKSDKIRRQISDGRRRLGELKRIFSSLYKEKALGEISETQYDAAFSDYHAEQTRLERGCAELQSELDTAEISVDDVAQFSKTAAKYAAVRLTKTREDELICELVDRVMVLGTTTPDGCGIEIHFNFIGNFSIPPCTKN